MIITHDPDEAVYMSDRICMMTNGPHAKVGEVMEIEFERPRNHTAIVETDQFYEYRRRLLQFLDDCEAEKRSVVSLRLRKQDKLRRRDLMSEPFNSEQKQYLEGFFAGVNQRPQSMPFLGQNAAGQFTGEPTEAVEDNVYGTPIDDLCKEELIKHEQNGLDVWSTMEKNAEIGTFPEGGDMFRYKFYGLFHVKPAQDSFMLRCRIAGCALSLTRWWVSQRLQKIGVAVTQTSRLGGTFRVKLCRRIR